MEYSAFRAPKSHDFARLRAAAEYSAELWSRHGCSGKAKLHGQEFAKTFGPPLCNSHRAMPAQRHARPTNGFMEGATSAHARLRVNLALCNSHRAMPAQRHTRPTHIGPRETEGQFGPRETEGQFGPSPGRKFFANPSQMKALVGHRE